jgi:23S rRNA G2445 N2-methylase RlmL
VDVLLCDLPFGKMHGSVEQNRTLYPAMLVSAASHVTLRVRGVTLRARWVTLRPRWVTL